MSPKKTEDQENEKTSRRAFEAAVPGRWVLNDLGDDFGVDYLVDIASADGELTGQTFHAQIKSIRSQGTAGFPTVRIESDRIRYYTRNPVPVLLVLYVVDTGTLYAEWIHRFPKQLGKAFSDQESVGYSFERGHLWIAGPQTQDGTSPNKILHELSRFSSAHGPALPRPLEIAVSGREQVLSSVAPFIALGLHGIGGNLATISDAVDSDNAMVKIVLTETTISADFVGMGAVSLEVPPHDSHAHEVFANDVILAAGLAVGRLGHATEAFELCSSAIGKSHFAFDLEVLSDIASLAIYLNRHESMIGLAHALIASGAEIGHNASNVVLGYVTQDETSVRRLLPALIGVQRAQRAIALSEGNPRLEAAACFNTCVLLTFAQADVDAYEEIMMAVRICPEYGAEPHVQFQQAYCLLTLDRWKDAIEILQPLVTSGYERARPMLAEAYVLCGEYESALTEFLRIVPEDEDGQTKAALSAPQFEWLVTRKGIKLQRRQTKSVAEEFDRRGATSASPEEVWEVIHQCDALPNVLWQTYAEGLRRRGQFDDDYLNACRFASQSDVFNPLSWAFRALAEHSAGLSANLELVLRNGYVMCGDEFVRLVTAPEIGDLTNAARQHVLTLLPQVIKHAQAQPRPVVAIHQDSTGSRIAFD